MVSLPIVEGEKLHWMGRCILYQTLPKYVARPLGFVRAEGTRHPGRDTPDATPRTSDGVLKARTSKGAS